MSDRGLESFKEAGTDPGVVMSRTAAQGREDTKDCGIKILRENWGGSKFRA